ncbi:MAG: tellurite resistance TerB family protein [Deltaproteobacteria bacterium]|jgi:tellurite resistance protein|nr:tellurite resistance TerB family protein [Deltaproteobacteria bacterium]MBW2531303.1 tellurite resistance TerB family protein [Deltaproteobacteria bacterium]
MEDPGEDFVRRIDDDTLEALVETMYLAACADGEFSDDERSRFAESVEYLTRGRLTGDRLRELLARVSEQHRSAERSERIATIKERLTTAEIRQIALVLASDVAAADGVLHDAERDVILALGEALEISPGEIDELLGSPGTD